MLQTWIVESTERIEFDKILNGLMEKFDTENYEVVEMLYTTCFIPAKHPRDYKVFRSMVISYKPIHITPKMLGETGK